MFLTFATEKELLLFNRIKKKLFHKKKHLLGRFGKTALETSLDNWFLICAIFSNLIDMYVIKSELEKTEL